MYFVQRIQKQMRREITEMRNVNQCSYASRCYADKVTLINGYDWRGLVIGIERSDALRASQTAQIPITLLRMAVSLDSYLTLMEQSESDSRLTARSTL